MADYPISNVSRRIVYTGSAGVGPYAFLFEVLTSADINVYKNNTLLTLTTNYTVTISPTLGTGSITLVLAATNADRITIVGARAIQRTTDFTTGGDFFANTLNDEMDSQTILVQQVAETADRSIKAPVTDPTSINMVLPINTVRAGKILAFNASGNPIAGEAIGNWRGNWSAGVSFQVRDFVKDTTNSNVYIALVAHTSSGVLPISTNADSAKWDLLVEADAVKSGLGANSYTGNQTIISGAALNTSSSTLASSATPNIWTNTSNIINYTGTTTATGFTAAPQAGVARTLILAGAASFTAGGNMLIDGVVSFTGAAGDEVEVFAITTTQFRLRPKLASGTAGSNIAQTFSGGQRGAVTALTSTAASIAINLATNNNFSHTTSENSTLAAPSNPTAGQSGVIVITQGATARTLAYNTFYKFAGGTVPTLTATASAVDTFAYYVESATRATCQLIKNVS